MDVSSALEGLIPVEQMIMGGVIVANAAKPNPVVVRELGEPDEIGRNLELEELLDSCH